jgi:hypothetical protein
LNPVAEDLFTPGTRVRATVCNATSVSAVITDRTSGGARFGVWVNASSADDPHAANVPNLRVATFFTSEGYRLNYALASRSAIRQSCVTYTLQLLVEPAFIQDSGPAAALTVEGLLTDGRLVATPEPAVERGEKEIGGSGGSLDPPGPLRTHPHTVYMAYSECLPTRLNPVAERTCFFSGADIGRLRRPH